MEILIRRDAEDSGIWYWEIRNPPSKKFIYQTGSGDSDDLKETLVWAELDKIYDILDSLENIQRIAIG